jgi:hypothetical protein
VADAIEAAPASDRREWTARIEETVKVLRRLKKDIGDGE